MRIDRILVKALIFKLARHEGKGKEQWLLLCSMEGKMVFSAHLFVQITLLCQHGNFHKREKTWFLCTYVSACTCSGGGVWNGWWCVSLTYSCPGIRTPRVRKREQEKEVGCSILTSLLCAGHSREFMEMQWLLGWHDSSQLFPVPNSIPKSLLASSHYAPANSSLSSVLWFSCLFLSHPSLFHIPCFT